MKLSGRVRAMTASATLEVSRRAAELRAQGREIIDFGAGEPDFASPPVAVEAARQALADGFTHYTANAGLPELRQALADRFAALGAPWSAAQVLVTVGAKAALFELALALFEAGDEVVVPMPCWVSFPEQVRFSGATLVPVALDKDDGFRIRAAPVVAALGDRTRAVILNSPSNPTGGVVSAADLVAIVEAAAARGAVVIGDETYERFIYGDESHASVAPLAARFPDTVILVGSFSKTYAMTGWRVGYACGPTSAIAAASKIQGHATSNVTSFAMKGALAALEQADADVEAMLAEFRFRRSMVVAGLNRCPGVSCAPPAGAFYAFPDVSRLYGPELDGSVAFARFLLDEAGVAVVPGIAFGDDRHVRLSFACSRDALARGLERFASAVGRVAG